MLGLGSVCGAKARPFGSERSERTGRVERSRQTPGIRCQLCPHLQVNSRLWCVLNITATGAFMNRVPATGAIPRLCPCKIFASWFKHVPNWPEMKKKHEKKKVSGPLFLRLVSLRILRKINFWIWWNVSKTDRNFLFSHGNKTSSKTGSRWFKNVGSKDFLQKYLLLGEMSRKRIRIFCSQEATATKLAKISTNHTILSK